MGGRTLIPHARALNGRNEDPTARFVLVYRVVDLIHVRRAPSDTPDLLIARLGCCSESGYGRRYDRANTRTPDITP